MRHKLASAVVWILLSVVTLCGQDLTQDSPPVSPATAGGSSKPDLVNDNVDSGLQRAWTQSVEKASASQPHVVAPLVTTHVILVQQVRYDMFCRADPSGGTTTPNYGR